MLGSSVGVYVYLAEFQDLLVLYVLQMLLTPLDHQIDLCFFDFLDILEASDPVEVVERFDDLLKLLI